MLRLGGVGQLNKLTSNWKQWWPESDERSLKSCHWSLELSIQRSMCWFEASGVSCVQSEIGSNTRRTRKDQRKRQTSPDWQVAGLISKGIYIKGFLSWASPQKKQISAPASQNIKCLYRVLMGSVTYSVQTISTPYSLKAASLKKLQYWKSRHDAHSKDRGEIRASNCLGPVYGSTNGHILSITSSNTASETILQKRRWEKVLWFN